MNAISAFRHRVRIHFLYYTLFRSGIRFFTILGQNRYFLFFAAAVGLLTGCAAVLIRLITLMLENSRAFLPLPLYLIAPALGIFAAYGIRYRMKRKLQSSAELVNVIHAVRRRDPLLSEGHRKKMDVFSHILAAPVCAGLGASCGLTASGILSGAALGSLLGKFMQYGREKQIRLMACGTAGGLAAMFSSPVSGVLFAIEALHPHMNAGDLVPILISSAGSTVLAQLIFGDEPILMTGIPPWDKRFLLLCIPFGLLCAGIGVYMIRINKRLQFLLRKMTIGNKVLFCGTAVSILITLFPAVSGEGVYPVETLLSGEKIFLTSLIAGIFIKSIATTLTLSGGGCGGFFTPTLFTGAFLGGAFAVLLDKSEFHGFILLGISGVFAAAFKTPLTAIFLVLEMSGSYALMIPLILVAAVSYFCAAMVEPDTLYTAELPSAEPDSKAEIATGTGIIHAVKNGLPPIMTGKKLNRVFQLASSQAEWFPLLDEKHLFYGIIFRSELEKSKEKIIRPENLKITHPLILDENDSFAAAETAMRFSKMKSLPVISEDGCFKGTISDQDIESFLRNLPL